jgi:hypothetical protein
LQLWQLAPPLEDFIAASETSLFGSSCYQPLGVTLVDRALPFAF